MLMAFFPFCTPQSEKPINSKINQSKIHYMLESFCIALLVLFFLISNSKSDSSWTLLYPQFTWHSVGLGIGDPSFFLKHFSLLASLTLAAWISFSPVSCSFLDSFSGSTLFSYLHTVGVYQSSVLDFLSLFLTLYASKYIHSWDFKGYFLLKIWYCIFGLDFFKFYTWMCYKELKPNREDTQGIKIQVFKE